MSGVFVQVRLIVTIRSRDLISLLIDLSNRAALARPFRHPLTELAFLGPVQQVRRRTAATSENDGIDDLATEGTVPGGDINLTRIIKQVDIVLYE